MHGSEGKCSLKPLVFGQNCTAVVNDDGSKLAACMVAGARANLESGLIMRLGTLYSPCI